jgi:uncharacterized protein YgiB involved in biofilm formation
MVVKRPDPTERERAARRRSKQVTLVVLGATAGVVGLALIDTGPDQLRNRYASREDCEADYSARQCQDTSINGARGWYGPAYRQDWRTNKDPDGPGRYYSWRESESGRTGGLAGVESARHAPSSVTTVSRGGFGGRGFSGS